MKFVEVDCEFSGPCRSEIAFGIDRDIRVISFIGKERRGSGSSARSVIVCELGEWEQWGPIILLVIAVYTEILFQGLISAFCLTISFWVVSGGEVEFHVQCLSERPEEVGDEFGTSVTSNVRRNSMLRKDMKDKEVREFRSINSIVCRDEDTLLRKSVNNNEYGCIAKG